MVSSEDDEQNDENADGEDFDFNDESSGELPSHVKFQGSMFRIARTLDQFKEFVTTIKEKLASIASDKPRRMLLKGYSERTQYRAILEFHRWIIFWCTQSKGVDELTPDMLRAYRSWLLQLKVTPRFVDPKRQNQTLQAVTASASIGRVYIIYKLTGAVSVGLSLAKYMGGDLEFLVWRRWMASRLGIKTPFSRFEITAPDIDLFAEQLTFDREDEFQAVTYLLTMLETGARTASLLKESDSTHPGLLVQDVMFNIMPDGRLTAEITITREKQSRDVNRERKIKIEDRVVGFSLPEILFVHFVRLGAFVNKVDDIRNVNKPFASRGERFEYKKDVKRCTVFRTSDSATGKLSVRPLTRDTSIFWLYSKTMRLPRRGFTARSVRQGQAISIIDPMVRKEGYFNEAQAIQKLKSTGVWRGKAGLIYIDDYEKKRYNATANIYGSEVINKYGDQSAVRKYVSPAQFRLPEDEYVTDDNEESKYVFFKLWGCTR